MVVQEQAVLPAPAALQFAPELSAASLSALAHGELAGIWHRAYYEPSDCQCVLRAIRLLAANDDYTLTDDFQCIGTSIGEAHSSAEKQQQYFDEAALTTRVVRDVVFRGLLSPIDRLRLELDELWPAGSQVARVERTQMLPAVIRRWPPGGAAHPHRDPRDMPLLQGLGLTRRLGVNVYLQTPPATHGGDLEFWDLRLSEPEFQALKRPGYGFDRARIGPPAHVIHPEMGDLILLDTSLIHAITDVVAGERVTVGCFVGVRSLDSPLRVFA